MTLELKKLLNIMLLWLVIAVGLSAAFWGCGCRTAQPRETVYLITEPTAIVVCNNAAFVKHCEIRNLDPWRLHGYQWHRMIWLRESSVRDEWTLHEIKNLPEMPPEAHCHDVIEDGGAN